VTLRRIKSVLHEVPEEIYCILNLHCKSFQFGGLPLGKHASIVIGKVRESGKGYKLGPLLNILAMDDNKLTINSTQGTQYT
jgi:hypothetical protein